jgi:gliding motility-associated-like protein
VDGPGACAGLSDTASIHVAIAARPDLVVTVVPASGCAPLAVTLIPQYGAAVVELTWQLGDGSVAVQNGPLDHTYVQPGTYNPSIQYMDTAGCVWETTNIAPVAALPPPNVGVQVRRAVIPLDDAVVEAWPVGDACRDHLWKVNGAPVDTTVELRYRFDPPTAGHQLVCVEATDSLGCAAEACAVVLVDDVLIVHVPNAFTPNGDGINDTFEPVLVGADAEDFGFWIFDRWGEMVFEANEPGLPWNGAMKGTGDLLPDGVYAWRMIVRDAFSAERREYFGHVSLIK